MSIERSRRWHVREMLELLASEAEQLDYERNVPHVNITVELLCMWFDDLYSHDSPASDTTFSEQERIVLQEFHQFYHKRIKLLPESKGTVRTWLDSDVWQEVMKKANETLLQIGLDD